MSRFNPGDGRPLDGIRILAIEQMQALPFATQLLARLGAEVVKVEPITGESARASTPFMRDPQGRPSGATFLRNNLNKRSILIDLKSAQGREIVLRLASRFDVIAENSKSGAMDRLGLGYDDIAAVHPAAIYLSVSGFGNLVPTAYRDWPAYASIVEGMSGVYEFKRRGADRPRVAPMGGLGDIGAALFASVGVLAALRQRDRTGHGQYVDIAMFDAVVAMTDVVTNFWSMGVREDLPQVIVDAFRADDGWFILQVGREAQFGRMGHVLGHPEWTSDARFTTRAGWIEHLEDTIRPAIETWARGRTRLEACRLLSDAGLAAGPCLTPDEVLADQHLRARNMLIAIERTDDVPGDVIVPGNPVKFAGAPELRDERPPWQGEHTDETLGCELGLSESEISRLRVARVVA